MTKKQNYSQCQIVEKEGPFMPVIFADLPATLCAGIVAKAAHELSEKIDDGGKKFAKIEEKLMGNFIQPILSSNRLSALSSSIDDIIL